MALPAARRAFTCPEPISGRRCSQTPLLANLPQLLAVILLRAKSNDYEDLSSLIDEVNNALDSITPGTLLTVPAEGPL
jgi:hypothetical protein